MCRGAIIQFGTVIDGATTICRAHGDILEDIEKHGLPAGSRQMVEAFHRHEDLLRRLALEKAVRGMAERDGTVFLGPILAFPGEPRSTPEWLAGDAVLIAPVSR